MSERPTEAEIVAALRAATEVLECLRRGHGVEVSAACFPALNECRDVLERLDRALRAP